MSFDPFGEGSSDRPPETPRRPKLSSDHNDGDYNPDAAKAREQLLLPGMMLLVAGFLNLLAGFACIGGGFLFTRIPPEQLEKQLAKQQPEDLAKMKESGVKLENVLQVYTYGGIGGGIVVILAALITLIGGVCILMQRGYALAAFSSVVTAIPCISPLACPCLVGMLLGVWAITVLLNPDVRQSFQ